MTISIEDLHALKNMVTEKDIDYEEIDRILNVMFTPLENSFPKCQDTIEFFSDTNIEVNFSNQTNIYLEIFIPLNN